MGSWSRIAAFAGLVAALSVSPAGAQCACADTATCRGFHESDFVFTAKVSAIRYLEPVVIPGEPPLAATEGVATLVVGEVFRGVVPTTVDVPMGGDCEVSFQAGEEYLVYGASVTYGPDGRVDQVGVSGCSRTRRLDEAGDDLRVIRQLAARRPDASLHGYIAPYDVVAAIFDDAPVYQISTGGQRAALRVEDDSGALRVQFSPPRPVRADYHARGRLRAAVEVAPGESGMRRRRRDQDAMTDTGSLICRPETRRHLDGEAHDG